ncbi:manganese/zinc/iron transport system permease protein [Flexibacter flexilis DSM 6793]|uniref:Manganese/zinc/iron transport system permease protein n=1 Tax=Flexibacter flexilis DSM 6793 TaxID=927664 RepID=A0A1I1HA48_9BACT|nr:iron chelate uptake ABC transporter family permease subunit [Flexibacter flexilis]SFC18353.1 manganese/zinc/iron transport system permease protein [Flexibacter flexilis DSM 6793]
MSTFWNFITFADPNIKYIVLGTVLLSVGSAVVGCFSFLRKRALVGDAVAHSVLPGVCLAFMLSGTKNPLWLLLGAFVTGWLSLLSIDFISKNSKLKEDTSIGLVLSVFFGIGILLLTHIQQSGEASQSGLDKFLFGKAASLIGSDLWLFLGVVSVLLLITFLFFKEFTLLSFDKQYAAALGLPVRGLELLLTTLTVLAVVIGIQSVGVVLMAAMLITPAAAARYWTHDIRKMVALAATFGAISGITGAYISYAAPAMPTGPWIVLVVSLLAVVSFSFAPRKGIVGSLLLQRKNRLQIIEENILKALFHLGEQENDFFKHRSFEEIIIKRDIEPSQLRTGLRRLRQHGYVLKEHGLWTLTPEGQQRGKRVTKLHRLWEMYLTTHLNIAPDHVHDDAETMEHIITPEIERALEEQLRFPTTDPHGENIPY